jgi:hydroxylamine reductase
MFCYQCEQTAKGTGCTSFGVCGKDPNTAALQDLLLHATTGIAQYAHRAAQLGFQDKQIDLFVVEALFTTVTNVNFDANDVANWVAAAAVMRDRARELYLAACDKNQQTPEVLDGAAVFAPAGTFEALVQQGGEVSVEGRINALGPDLSGLQELTTYGLKGAAAYADHAQVLGVYDAAIFARFHAVLNALTDVPEVNSLTGLALSVGELNFQVMELLDKANTEAYGHPEPTPVNVNPVIGKAILVSGHDLKDLKALLEQTQGKGVNIYTHGEMLPAHGYPELKKYPHLVGNYGGAWQDQRKEFDAFPGAILMTTNCIQMPKPSYLNRIFTSGLVQWPEVTHIDNGDFSAVIDAALAAEGFTVAQDKHEILVGFGRNAVLGVAGQVVEAVKAGDIKHFFLVGGCDGAKSGRNYYTDFAEQAPKDTVILTLACGKFRFNKLDFGDIGGIPRLLDVGQCNDAYSAIQIALALANAFETDVNSLPLSMILSWYEQKAVAILLTLLHLGIKNIKLGPSLPAFVSPAVLNVLVENFGLAPVTTAEADLAAALA